MKIEFYPKEKGNYNEERTYEPEYGMGTYGDVLGNYTKKDNVVNAKVDDKTIKILWTQDGSIIVDGSSENFVISKHKYDFQIGEKTYSVDFPFSNAEKLAASKFALIEADELKALVNKTKLSRSDLMAIEANLEARHNMPENIRSFTSFEDLQTKIYQNPEKLKENVNGMFNLMKAVNKFTDKYEENEPLKNLMKIMKNLRNTDNHEFNMQFKDCVKEIVNKHKRVDKMIGCAYWSTDDRTGKILDKMKPLSKMQYSLPKYLKIAIFSKER